MLLSVAPNMVALRSAILRDEDRPKCIGCLEGQDNRQFRLRSVLRIVRQHRRRVSEKTLG
jgi:hypothetical protein